MNFTHLHVHSHYSILDGMSKVPDLIEKARRTGMNAIALTDHGNMYGIKELTDYANKINGASKKKLKDLQKSFGEESDESKKTELEKQINELKAKMEQEIPFKPIVGIEAYCARRTLFDKDKNVKFVNPENGREQITDRSGWHLILLAKNKKGYQNLCKLTSMAFTDGFYDRPRIDKNILEKYHEGIIVCSACLGGEIPQLVIGGRMDEAEASINWFKNIFGDDYYIELQRHQTNKPNAETRTFERQQQVIPMLVELARKTNTKIIATNDVHFVEEEHGEAHDRLICLSTGKDLNDPNRMHYTKQEWLKTPEEMAAIFADYPEAIDNTQEIVDKVEFYSIESGPIMPKFDIPASFGTEEEYRKKYTEKDLFDEFTQNEKGEVVMGQEDAEAKIKKIGGYEKLYRIKLEADYLAKLTWEGAERRYGDTLDDKKRDQIKFELHVMKTMGFPGYFLIVADYIRAAREELNVSVGPGRGSAAGSVVAYCLKITDIDPLKYDLLFERFLNPDRISLPDIDVDFDDEGRGKVLDWVTQKYGKEKVAHIITYGTMATKSSIADVGRVQGVPLSEVNLLKTYIPDKFDDFADPDGNGKTFAQESKKAPKVKLKNCFKLVPELKDARYGEDSNVSSMLEYAEQLEDTNRQIGIHACGVIIGADDLTKFAPLCTIKDKESGDDVLVTQYDGHVIESVGLIKMDFLGLSTLSLIKETIKNIKHTTGQIIDIDAIPLDDKLTYELFSNGRTVGVFQFESPGMQKYLRELQPSVITDLIAMNALYRPGPIEYIPQFIRRKHGKEEITYDIPVMEKYLKDTYGVTVYQEQVMLLSRLLAGFTRGQSDALRKAMGKKLIAILNDLKPKFIDGGVKNGHDPKVLEKIWKDWEAFASYAFNKSHAACYAWVAYQTGYLKAHYPAEYMAANLTQSKDTIADVTKFMDECKKMGLKVLPPDVNESENDFTVNIEGNIRYGLAGIKGVGEAAVAGIIAERQSGGLYKDVFDFFERTDYRCTNKKTIENLINAGGFDSFGYNRSQFFQMVDQNMTVLDRLVNFGIKTKTDGDTMQISLFGDQEEFQIQRPIIPVCPEWSDLEKSKREKEMVGIYLTSHPLSAYRMEMSYMCKPLNSLKENLAAYKEMDVVIGGVIVDVRMGKSKKGNDYAFVTLEDFSGTYEVAFFDKNYIKYVNFFTKETAIYIRGHVGARKYGNTNDVTFQVLEVDLLSTLFENVIKSITLNIDITNNLTIEIMKELADNYLEHPQSKEEIENTVPLKVVLYYQGQPINLFSRRLRVKSPQALYEYLEQFDMIKMKIN